MRILYFIVRIRRGLSSRVDFEILELRLYGQFHHLIENRNLIENRSSMDVPLGFGEFPLWIWKQILRFQLTINNFLECLSWIFMA